MAIPTGGLAQVVTPGITGQLTSVDVRLWYSGTPTQGVTVGIRNVSGGLPTGSDLASGFVPDSSIGGVAAWLSVPLSTPISVTAGTQFAIVVTTTNNANDYMWRMDAAGTYAGGQAFQNSGTWVVMTGDSMNFRTYVNTADSGPTPPPVMQQFGMPVSGTCEAAAPIVLNWGGAGSGGWGNSWAQWMNGGSGGAVCTRTLVYSDALGRWIVG
jgi:hypothetical protein